LSDAITYHTTAVAAAEHINSQLNEANALHDLGITQRLAGNYFAATQALEAALGEYRNTRNQLGQANALNDLGMVRYAIDDYQGAAAVLQQALSGPP
jgi:tetratricopeptide (TPR) repeat protein